MASLRWTGMLELLKNACSRKKSPLVSKPTNEILYQALLLIEPNEITYDSGFVTKELKSHA